MCEGSEIVYIFYEMSANTMTEITTPKMKANPNPIKLMRKDIHVIVSTSKGTQLFTCLIFKTSE